jgi:hypothetical protein
VVALVGAEDEQRVGRGDAVGGQALEEGTERLVVIRRLGDVAGAAAAQRLLAPEPVAPASRAVPAALAALAGAVSEVPARPKVPSMAAELAAAVTRNRVVWRVSARARLVDPLLMSLLPKQQAQQSPRRRPRVLTIGTVCAGL